MPRLGVHAFALAASKSPAKAAHCVNGLKVFVIFLAVIMYAGHPIPTNLHVHRMVDRHTSWIIQRFLQNIDVPSRVEIDSCVSTQSSRVGISIMLYPLIKSACMP